MGARSAPKNIREKPMKTLRNKFDELCSFENLWQAYGKARRGKRYGEPAANFDFHYERSGQAGEVPKREGAFAESAVIGRPGGATEPAGKERRVNGLHGYPFFLTELRAAMSLSRRRPMMT